MGKKSNVGKIDRAAFLLPAIISIIFVGTGLLFPDAFGAAVSGVNGFITEYFSWFYALGTTFLVFVCIWIALGKHGNVRLGGENAKPELSWGAWFTITFTTGMGMGIVFYSVGEPLMNFVQPAAFTGFAPYSLEATENSLPYVFVHWFFSLTVYILLWA